MKNELAICLPKIFFSLSLVSHLLSTRDFTRASLLGESPQGVLAKDSHTDILQLPFNPPILQLLGALFVAFILFGNVDKRLWNYLDLHESPDDPNGTLEVAVGHHRQVDEAGVGGGG